jgi:[acyl-carrier-protein] S-malonyltransferase
MAKARGARRAIMLQVSAPFHCSLMRPAQERLQKDLEQIVFHDLVMPLISNVDAELKRKGSEARDALVRQATGAVRWEESMRKLVQLGVETFIEVGPGRVLCGLMRQIDRARTCLNAEDEASLQKTINHVGQHKSDPG